MDPLISLPDVRHALRRSRVRAAILLALLRLGETAAADLLRLAGADPKHFRGALYGNEEDYTTQHALTVLGLVQERATEGRVLYRLTPLGRAVARAYHRETLRAMTAQPRTRT